jgi:hypothetical protein
MHVGIHADPQEAETEVANEVRRLSSHAGKREKLLHLRGHLPSMLGQEEAGRRTEVFRLCPIEARRVDEALYPRLLKRGKGVGRGRRGQQALRGDAGHLVLCSQGDHRGYKNPKRIRVLARNGGDRGECLPVTGVVECLQHGRGDPAPGDRVP